MGSKVVGWDSIMDGVEKTVQLCLIKQRLYTNLTLEGWNWNTYIEIRRKKRRASTALKGVRDSSADTIESSSSTSTRGDCLKGWTKGDTIMSQYVFQAFGFFCTALSFLCPWSVQLRKFITQIKIQPCMSHENAQVKLWPDVTWNMFPELLFGRSRYWIPIKHAGGTKEEEKPAVRGKIMVGARLSLSFFVISCPVWQNWQAVIDMNVSVMPDRLVLKPESANRTGRFTNDRLSEFICLNVTQNYRRRIDRSPKPWLERERKKKKRFIWFRSLR